MAKKKVSPADEAPVAEPAAASKPERLTEKPKALRTAVRDGELGEYQLKDGTILRWSGEDRLPAIGSIVPLWIVYAKTCKVVGYFREADYLGVIVEQEVNGSVALRWVFGSEIGEERLDGDATDNRTRVRSNQRVDKKRSKDRTRKPAVSKSSVKATTRSVRHESGGNRRHAKVAQRKHKG